MRVDSTRLRFVAGINTRVLPETTDPGFEFRYIDIGSVGRGHLVADPETMVFEDAPSRARRVIRAGDSLVSTVRTYLRAVLPVGGDLGNPIASTGFAVLTPGPRLEPRYLGWVAQSDPFIEEIVARSTGVSYPAINALEIGNLEIPTPPVDVQRAIAGFLDAETARIDTLIARKRGLIATNIERRMAVMTDGLRGQFTSADEPRPSDLPWLDVQPAAWRNIKLSYAAKLGSGHTPSRQHPEWWVDCTIPWITTGEVAQVRDDRREVIEQTRERISELGLANSAATVHPAGTVVLCRTASAGYSAIMGSDMATSQDFATWTCGRRLAPRFLLLCLRVMRQDLLGRLAMGSTHKTIYMPDIEALRIPLPDLAEQEAVVEAVTARLQTLDKTVDLLRRQIDLLVEHRQALITAAVTGEIEVPGVAA